MRYGEREELLTYDNPTRRLETKILTMKAPKLVCFFVIFELVANWYQHCLFRLEVLWVPQVVLEGRRTVKVFGMYFDDTIWKRATSKSKMVVQQPPPGSEPYLRCHRSLLPYLVLRPLLNLCRMVQVRPIRRYRIE